MASDHSDDGGWTPVHATSAFQHGIDPFVFPARGMEPDAAYELLHTALMLDGRPTLNLASFVTTWMEPQAEVLIQETLRKNHIDHEEYPAASLMEEACVFMLGSLFNAPDSRNVVGVATIGSSEAIMLGLLAHKWSWRARRQAAGKDSSAPNVVFGAETHVVWDKFAKYFDVEMRKIPMKRDRYVVSPEEVADQVDENTIAVGAVLGTTHIGEADPIKEINDVLLGIKAEHGWDIPLHVDGASGAFIAPFAEPEFEFDFRLEQVASINASGHKYGLVYPGVGWLIFRDRTKLPEELVFSVNYLGGAQPTYTFNFSRGSSMIQAQGYNFLRLGREGYTELAHAMLTNARYLNDQLDGSGKFEILNPGLAEPVVTFRIKGDPGFDVYHLSARLRENGWIVPAYSLPPDADDVHVMRVVVRVELSRRLIDLLLLDLLQAWDALAKEHPPSLATRRPDVWTNPTHAAAHSKRRTQQRPSGGL